jgi:hypothetical protein
MDTRPTTSIDKQYEKLQHHQAALGTLMGKLVEIVLNMKRYEEHGPQSIPPDSQLPSASVSPPSPVHHSLSPRDGN